MTIYPKEDQAHEAAEAAWAAEPEKLTATYVKPDRRGPGWSVDVLRNDLSRIVSL